jgi:hypothetical protein
MSGYVCIAMLEDPPFSIYLAATEEEPEDWCAGLPLPSHLLCYEKFNDPGDFVQHYAKALLVCAIRVLEGKAFPAPAHEVIRCFMKVRDKVVREGGVDTTLSDTSIRAASALAMDPTEKVQSLPREPEDHEQPTITDVDTHDVKVTADVEEDSDEGIDYDIFEFIAHEEHAVLTRYIGFDDTSIIIPSRWNGLPVTAIGDSAFEKAIDLCDIVIKDGIESIGKSAFSECHKLRNIKLPDTLNIIGEGAFNECKSLSEIEVPPLVDRIMPNAFYKCEKLKKVTLSEGVEKIESRAFQFCSELYSISFPSTIRAIGPDAFGFCSLRKVVFKEGLEAIGSGAFTWCRSLAEAHIPNSATRLGYTEGRLGPENIFYSCNKLTVFCKPRSDIQAYCREHKIKCAKAI